MRGNKFKRRFIFGINWLRKWFFFCFYFECLMLKKFKKIWYSYCLFLGVIVMVILYLDLLIVLIGVLVSSSLVLIFLSIIELLILSVEGNRFFVLIIVKDVVIMLLGFLGCIIGIYVVILGIVNVLWFVRLLVIVTRYLFCLFILRIWCYCKFLCLSYCICWKYFYIY